MRVEIPLCKNFYTFSKKENINYVFDFSMAADSDGPGSPGGGGGGGGGSTCGVIVTCEGDLRDPRFPARLRRLLRELRSLLAEPHPHTLKVNKVWDDF